jgi:hypothetical protein
MRQLCGYAFTFVLACVLSACGGSPESFSYGPDRPPVPLLTHQGELNISGSAEVNQSPGFDVHAAYAETDHIAAIASAQISHSPNPNGLHYNQSVQLGIGYIDSLDHLWHSETYAIVGVSSGSLQKLNETIGGRSSGSDTAHFTALRLGLQQNIGIEGKIAAIGAGLQAGVEYMPNFFHASTSSFGMSLLPQPNGDVQVSTINTHPFSSLYLEPIFLARLGYKSVKLLLEVWFELRSNTSENSILGTGNSSVGLSVDF